MEAPYENIAKQALFVTSKASALVNEVDKYLVILEVEEGARVGAGRTPSRLQGFPEDQPLGPSAIATNDTLRLHYTKSDWVELYAHYASLTKYGVLILAGTVEVYKAWALSSACRKEVATIPPGRLFAYVRHDSECDPPNKGYIVSVNLHENNAAATVSNGFGLTLYGTLAPPRDWLGEPADDRHPCPPTPGRQVTATITAVSCTRASSTARARTSGRMARSTRYVQGDRWSVPDRAHQPPRLQGAWVDDKLNGVGTYTWANGASYHGEYKDGKRDGDGVYKVAPCTAAPGAGEGAVADAFVRRRRPTATSTRASTRVTSATAWAATPSRAAPWRLATTATAPSWTMASATRPTASASSSPTAIRRRR